MCELPCLHNSHQAIVVISVCLAPALSRSPGDIYEASVQGTACGVMANWVGVWVWLIGYEVRVQL